MTTSLFETTYQACNQVLTKEQAVNRILELREEISTHTTTINASQSADYTNYSLAVAARKACETRLREIYRAYPELAVRS